MIEFLAINFSFLELGFFDILDIVLVAILLFYVYKLLKGSVAFNIFIGIAFLYLIWYFVKALDMKMLARILGQFIELGVLAFVILFQPEIRRFLLLVGKGRTIAKSNVLKRFFQQEGGSFEVIIEQIIIAIKNMSKDKTGALIVISGSTQLQYICTTGIALNADISAKLLESIFEKKSPLHDGAVVISSEKILAAGCTLTLSENTNLPKRVGTRHRAGVGVSERSDAITFIVSEENGKISIADNGKLDYNIDEKTLRKSLRKAFSITQ